MIDPGGEGVFSVQCDQNTDGGGWTVIQQRLDGSVDFFKDWNEYKLGFGDIYGEYWLGNENILRLTRQHVCELRVFLKMFDGSDHEAGYTSFTITGESDGYRLKLGAFLGQGTDGMSHNNNKQFITKNNTFHGAWWYSGGSDPEANLNGKYYPAEKTAKTNGINWFPWHNSLVTLREAKMMIRRKKGK